jgi:hypothetical protein
MTIPSKLHQDRVSAWQQYARLHYLAVLDQPGPCPPVHLIKPMPFRTWLAQLQQEAA